MIILNETSEGEFLKLNRLKLENMKDHLEALLRKKLRLEIEIKSLKKSIANRSKQSEKKISTRLTLEGYDFTLEELVKSQDLISKLREEEPQIFQEISRLYHTEGEIQFLLDDFEEERI